eukprot:symbB.v1.2.001009.t2/scaffold43.1/size391093/38
MWQTITDPETMAPSAQLGRMLHNQHLNVQNEKEMLTPQWEKELLALQQLGFSHADSLAAIRSTSGDVDAAAELLLMSGAGVEEPLQVESHRGGRFQKRQARVAVSPDTEGRGASSASTDVPPTEEDDEQLAKRLQEEVEMMQAHLL